MSDSRNIVLIGSSTGGPRVLEDVFRNMLRLNASVVIVHQMVKMMNELLRDRLARVTEMPVVVAQNGMALEHGKIYLAPSEIHLKLVSNSTIQLVEGERVNNLRPSIDVAMKSVEAQPGSKIIGVILTGAGKDGAEGIKHIKSIGGVTIAQEEKSCPLPTMPRAAADTGCVDSILVPEDIADRLIRVFGLQISYGGTGTAGTAVS